MKNYVVVPLDEIIKSKEYDINKIDEAFKKFECKREKDLCNFLINHAVHYDQSGIGKTFLFLNREKLEQESEFSVSAYITLANKALDISCLSKTQKKKLFGLYPGVDKLNSVSVFLIGQLGRADYCPKDEITGEDLLNECYSIFKNAYKYTGGKFIFLECREYMYEKFYEAKGFNKLKQELNEKRLYELYKKVNFDDMV